MKNKIYYSFSLTLGVALLVTSCTKSDEYTPQMDEDREVSITVSLNDATRVGVDGVDVYWESGDQMLFYGSNSYFGASTTANTTTSSLLTLISNDDDTATFTGSLSSTITGQVSGIYPGYQAFLNYGTNSAMYYSSLRILQPTYFQYTYTDGDLDPSSIGDYCFMHFLSDQSSASAATELTGKVTHLMSYVDFNLESAKHPVQRVFLALDNVLAYPSMKVATDGTRTMDSYLDYILDASGSTEEYAKVNVDYFVVDLRDSATSELGVSANSEGIIPIRIPFIPQHLVGGAKLFVQYDDGSEDIVSLNFPLTILSAGKVSNFDSTIDLSSDKIVSLPAGAATPKLGDFYYADGTYSNILDTTKDTPVGIVYQLMGSGADTKISTVFSTTIGKTTAVNTSTVGASTNDLTLVPNGAVNNYDGLLNVSMMAANARVHAKAASVGIDENSTIFEVCEKFYPAYAEALKKVSATDYSTGTDKGYVEFTGDETGIWYLPSLYEGYRFAVDVNTLQGRRVLYYNERLDEITAITSLGATATPGYMPVIPTTNANYQHLTSVFNGASKFPYVRHRSFHYMDANSDNYIKSYSSNSYTSTIYRPIMKVNVE